jgi:hypothetical protein
METANSTNKYSKLSDLLDKIITRYDTYNTSIINQIDIIENSLNNCLKDSETKPENEILEELSSDLLRKRPLSQMEENSKKFYKYISKLGKDIDKLQQVQAKDLHLYDIDFDHKSLKESIGEYLLHQVLQHDKSPKSMNQLKEIVDELGLISHQQLEKKYKVICNIKHIYESLEKKDLKPLKKWIGKQGKKLKFLKSDLSCKYLIVKAYYSLFELKQGINQTIKELKNEEKIIKNTKSPSLKRFFGSLIFLQNKKNLSTETEDYWNNSYLESEEVSEMIKQRYG